jgi:hypothetical protein
MQSSSSRRRTIGWVGRCALTALVAAGSLAARADELAGGDSAWARRAEGEREGRPLPGPILDAVRSYESALAARPAGDFASQGEEERSRIFDRARDVSEKGLTLLAERVASGTRLEEMDSEQMPSRLDAAGVPANDAARLYFWSAINWAAWSRDAGLLSAVRRGVANRLHRYVLVTIALEPDYEDGGAFRLLGRLHAELPRVPFISSWVDRDQSVPLVERAYAIAPSNPGNRLLLALTLLDLAPERRGEALDLLRQVEGLAPRPSMRIEDLAMRREARERLTAARLGEAT